MACSWNKQPVWQGTGTNWLNSVNDPVVGGVMTTVPNNYGQEFNQTLLGDHLVLDEAAANAAGNSTLPTLHGGYFQYVQLDPTIAGIGAISQTVTLGSGGTGYTAATTTVTFSAAPTGGVTATGTAVISSTGVIQGIQVTNQGSGYTAAPTVTITSTGAGTGATATATLVAATTLNANQALYWKYSGLSQTSYVVTPLLTGNQYNFAGVLLNPNWTPGYYSWIQVYGRTNVLVDAASAAITPGTSLYLSASTGTSQGSFTSTAPTQAAGAFAAIAESWTIATPVAGTVTLADIQKASLRF